MVEDVAEFRTELTCLHYMWPLYDNDFLSECILITLMWSTILGFPEPVGSTVKKIFLWAKQKHYSTYEEAFYLLWAKPVVISS